MLSLFMKAVKQPRRAVDELIYRTQSAFGHRGYRRFIILTRSRTGSNLLVTFLNSHPSVRTEGEVFNRLEGRDYSDILARVFDKEPAHIQLKGFKIFYYHPLDAAGSGLWSDLASLKDLMVIHLRRRNILRTLVSRKIAGQQDVWVLKSNETDKASGRKSVTFTREELAAGFRETRDWEDSAESRFPDQKFLSVDYEGLVKEPESEFERITGFLGLPLFPPKTFLRRQNPESLKDLIENYDELKADFSETEWSVFFED